MQRFEVSGALRPIYASLGVKRLNCASFKASLSYTVQSICLCARLMTCLMYGCIFYGLSILSS